MRFSKIEKRDLLKAWLVITLAFTNINVGLSLSVEFVIGFLMSGITVGVGFLAHELAHKYVAQRYGCFAEFRSFDQMLLISLLMSIFFRFIFVAPGAVLISGRVNKEQSGKISSAGIFTNILIALAFLFLIFLQIPIITTIAIYGVTINAWLALFNLIPFGNFDGIKVLNYNKFIYAGLILTSAILLMAPGLI